MHKGFLSRHVMVACMALAVMGFVAFQVVGAQTPDESVTPDQTSNQSSFNQCVTGNCESQRAACASQAGGDSNRLSWCENQVTRCIDACREGNDGYRFQQQTPAAVCGNDVCESPETSSFCPNDCPAPPPPACTVNDWKCGDWTDCSAAGRQTRTCTPDADCAAVETSKPDGSRVCTPSPSEVDENESQVPECERDIWICSAWSACSPQGQHTRTCKLDYDCPNVIDPSPVTTGPCTPPPTSEPPREEPNEESAVEPEAEPKEDEGLNDEARSLIQDFEKNTENVSGRIDVDGEVDYSTSIVTRCEDAGLSVEDCRVLLKTGLGFEACAAAGIATQESCAAFLTDSNAGVFPGCQGKTDEQCAVIKELTMVEILPESVKKEVDDFIKKLIDENKIMPLPGLMAMSADAAVNADWWTSAESGEGETSAGVLVIDTDDDGLPDDFEIANGLDPLDADSDDDGLSDLDEAKKLKLDPTALTIVFRKPLEQPRGAGETDETFTVQIPAGNGQDKVTLTGVCQPNSTCVIYIYSYIPMVLTVTTDADGRWSYDVTKDIADGSHVAYVAVTDQNGKIEKKSNPLSFFVREAQAVTEEDFVRPDANVVEPAQSFQRMYIAGAALLVFIALGLAWQVSRTVRGPRP